jgi:hypothetical protein
VCTPQRVNEYGCIRNSNESQKTDSEKLGQITNPTQGIGNKYTPRAE